MRRDRPRSRRHDRAVRSRLSRRCSPPTQSLSAQPGHSRLPGDLAVPGSDAHARPSQRWSGHRPAGGPAPDRCRRPAGAERGSHACRCHALDTGYGGKLIAYCHVVDSCPTLAWTISSASKVVPFAAGEVLGRQDDIGPRRVFWRGAGGRGTHPRCRGPPHLTVCGSLLSGTRGQREFRHQSPRLGRQVFGTGVVKLLRHVAQRTDRTVGMAPVPDRPCLQDACLRTVPE